MQALVKSPSSLVLRSKTLFSECSRSNEWRSKKLLRKLPCPLVSARLLSSCGVTLQNRQNAALQLLDPQQFIFRGSRYLSPSLSRNIATSPYLYEKEPLKPSSKVEETVNAIKEKSAEEAKAGPVAAVAPKKPPILTRIWHEVMHYYHGFRLLFIDINVSRKLLWRVLNGKSLSRREHKLLVRTVGDVFRLVPFSVFIIVPFMELLLPVAIKLFPGMLPSTFQTANERDDKLKQSLKVRLEMAKFLQTTLDDMSVQSKDQTTQSAKEFAEFFRKVRSSGEPATVEEILKFSKLFEDEITLDSLSRQQLTALCRVLDINPVGTTNLLRFQIRMRLRNLAADDKMIQKEGIDSLTIAELQAACQARAMRAYGLSEDKLKAQLAQWLDLSLNEKVPPSLLLLSRSLMLPETTPATDQLKATISALPDTVELKASAAISEREGVIDNKTKIQLIKEEEKRIREERAEMREERKRVEDEKKEILVDTAPIIGEPKKEEEISRKDLEYLEDALDTLGKEKKKMLVEKEELDELKEELQEYEEDVKELKELEEVEGKAVLQETRAAQHLFKKVNSMISKMDKVLADLEEKGKEDAKAEIKDKAAELVRIDELLAVIERLQKEPDDAKLAQISAILGKIDDDRDGAISVEEVLKVIELIDKENVQLNAKQLDEILQLLEKEEVLALEQQIEKALEKQSAQGKASSSSTKEKKGDQLLTSKISEPVSKTVAAGMSVSPTSSNGSPTTISEPKDPTNGTSKQL